MGKAARNLKDRLDGWLTRRGFTHPEVRELIRNQLLLTAVILAGTLPLAGVSAAAWSMAAGAVLITANFWSLAKFGQRITGFTDKREAVFAVLARFYLRLLLTGGALYALIVWLGANPLALLAGISTVVVNFLVWGVARHAEAKAHSALKGKEA